MKLTWRLRLGQHVGFLESEPETPLAFVDINNGYWLSCAFASNAEEKNSHNSLEAAQIRADELMGEWVQRHTLGWLVDPDAASIGAQLIDNERMRQIHEEGWTPAHDDEHRRGEMAAAGACYAYKAATQAAFQMGEWQVDEEWPWELDSWKPSDDPIRNLQKAGALIAAEIDRLMRAKGGTES